MCIFNISNVFYNTNNVFHLFIYKLFSITSQLYQASFHFLFLCTSSVFFYLLQRTRKLVFLCVWEIHSVSLSCLLVVLDEFFNFFVLWIFISRIFLFFRPMKFYSTDFSIFSFYKNL